MWRSFQPDELIADQYRVERVLTGGMGVVYIADDAVSGKRFALKTIRDDSASEESLARFEREARAWINLEHHPHIVQAHAFIRCGDQPFLLLEFIDGPSLSQVLKQTRPLAPAQAVHWAQQLCVGMQFVHGNSSADGQGGIVHRDLKPGNLLLTTSGTLKITDFGLAKVHDDRQLTATGQVLGTLSYCSPEQLRSTRNVDGRSDVFSFGVILYEMLSGCRPFTGDSPTEVIEAIQYREPDVSDIPDPLRSVVATCLQKSPGKRFATFHAVEQALRPINSGNIGTSSLIECDHCGFRHTIAIQCPVCANVMRTGELESTLIHRPDAGQTAGDPPKKNLCRCGVEVAADARFCRACGATLPTSQCACGQWNPSINQFCNLCGRKLNCGVE